MKTRSGTAIFLLVLLAILAFVWSTSSTLPDIVASHFGPAGTADGFVPRHRYVALLTIFIVGVPCAVAFLPGIAAGNGGKNLRIPHRDYWLAPERRENTIAFIQRHARWFASILALFMGYVHWLVLRANAVQPPHLPTTAFVSGLIAVLLCLVAWLAILYARFHRRLDAQAGKPKPDDG